MGELPFNIGHCQTTVDSWNEDATVAQEEVSAEQTASFWESHLPSYIFDNILAQSEDSIVWTARKQAVPSSKCAIKIISKPISGTSRNNHKSNQIKFLQSSSCPSMVQMQSMPYVSHQIVEGDDYTFIIMEYYELGSLKEYINSYPKSAKKLSPQHILFAAACLRETVRALGELHAAGYVHRDLKPQNWLIAEGILGDTQDCMVLCDFELVSEEGVYDESLCGTLEYMAPERLSQLRGNKPVRKSCDVWAIGIIAYELLMGSPPFEGEKPEQVLEEIYSGFIPGCEKLPQQAISLIKRILELNPQNRPSLSEIASHPFLDSGTVEGDFNIFALLLCD